MKTSPFTGMDPYLERPAKWRSVHTRLLNTISEQLADTVSPRFFVEIEERVILTLSDSPDAAVHIEPDVYLARGAEERTTREQTGGGQAVAATQQELDIKRKITTPTIVEAVYEDEIRERYLEVRDIESREVVTTIEVLSPFNKASGKRGHIDFLEKRRKVWTSNVHWVEIDLIRSGLRPAEVTGKSDYYSLLKRGGVFGQFEVWYIGLIEKLPTIAIPLLPGHEDAPLDLQDAFDTMYHRAHYGESVDYDADIPLPQMGDKDQAWVQQRITSWRS